MTGKIHKMNEFLFGINNDEVTVVNILNLLEARFLAGRGTKDKTKQKIYK